MKPDWGKPTVRNFRGEDGNGSYRAILLPERADEAVAGAAVLGELDAGDIDATLHYGR